MVLNVTDHCTAQMVMFYSDIIYLVVRIIKQGAYSVGTRHHSNA